MIRTIAKLAATAAIGFAAMVSAHAQETVRYATDGYSLGAIMVLAAENGYFKEEGIEPIIQSFAYGVDTVDAVLAGQADFGVIMDMPLITRLRSGKLVSPAIVGLPKPGFHSLYVAAGIEAPAGLKGKSIGVASGTSQEFVTRSYLTQNGLDPDKDVTLTGFSDLFSIIGAMKAGRLDAAWIWGEGIDTLKDDSKFAFVVNDSVIEQRSSALLTVSKEFAANSPDLLVKSLKAMDKAAQFINSDMDTAAATVAKKLGADTEKVKKAMSDNQYALSFAKQPMDSMRAKYDFLVGAGKIEAYDFMAQFSATALAQAVPNAEIDPQVAK